MEVPCGKGTRVRCLNDAKELLLNSFDHPPGAVMDSGYRGGTLYLVDLEVDPREG